MPITKRSQARSLSSTCESSIDPMKTRAHTTATQGGAGGVSLDIIRAILGWSEDGMARRRYQDPKIETRNDVKRAYYYIRPYVPIVTEAGILRKQRKITLGFCDQISKRDAKARREQIMAPINAGKFMIQSQIAFDDVIQKFLDARVPQLGKAAQDKYRTHIENHIWPAFKGLRMCDIDRPTVEAFLNREADPHTHMIGTDDEQIEERKFAGLGWWARQDLRNILSAIFTKAAE